MRDTWGTAPTVDISLRALTALVQPAFAGARVVQAEPVGGGLANANLRLTLSGRDEPVLLRFYIRDPRVAAKERAIAQRLDGLGPVPRYLYAADENDETGHAYAIVEWIEGSRLETVIPSATPQDRIAIAEAVGDALARIHSVEFPQAGFLDDQLDIAEPMTISGRGIAGYLRHCLLEGLGATRIERDLALDVIRLVDEDGRAIDDYRAPATLTHSDFGGSNILVHRLSGRWLVSGIVDWEFAFAGNPLFDLGNLLRPPLGDISGVAAGVAEGFRAAGGELPENWRLLALLVDLTAWAEFMSRPDIHPGVVESARKRFQQTAFAWRASA